MRERSNESWTIGFLRDLKPHRLQNHNYKEMMQNFCPGTGKGPTISNYAAPLKFEGKEIAKKLITHFREATIALVEEIKR